MLACSSMYAFPPDIALLEGAIEIHKITFMIARAYTTEANIGYHPVSDRLNVL